MAALPYGIALGSNLGDRLERLRRAREALRLLPASEPDTLLCGGVYETPPVGCPPGSPPFLNTALEIRIALLPDAVLAAALEIEHALGRVRPTARNAPRSIDIDLLYAGDRILRGPDLVLPHPRLARRGFVLRPLADIRPELRLPEASRSVDELLAALPPSDRDLPLFVASW